MYYGQNPGMMWGDGAGWFWMMGLHGIFWLVLLGAVIALAVALVRYLWRGPAASGQGGPGNALAVLEGRYARGEIEREEFLRKKQDLA